MAGGAWAPERRFKAGLRVSAACKHCGCEVADDLHQFWFCPPLRQLAEQAGSTRPVFGSVPVRGAFWCRALLPRAWWPGPETPRAG